MDSHPPDRAVVVGVTSAGKSTFGASLAQRIGAEFIELDALHWQPHWTPQDPDRFREVVDEATSAPRWVAAGGYSIVRDLTWGRADLLIWLDYSFPRVLWRLTRRTVARVVRREQLWNGNQETFRGAFLSRDSLFVWLLKTYWSRPKAYEQRLRDEFPDLPVVRFKNPREAQRWLDGLL